ncbi:tetraacyldisaccharide 4'-kinase [bacterium]|nr:tetraacyldisaccharide 4'-kinase [bacterium]
MKIWNHPALTLFLIPFSMLYEWIMQWRNKLYDTGFLRTHSVNAHVISVGNITVGGTGKTPVVETIARFFYEQGKRVAIQSRGYGRRFRGTLLVSDEKRVLASPEQSGDEPFMLAQHLPGIPVIVGSNRYGAVCQIIQQFHPDIVVLDDAFQHRRIHRDIDIVTIDASMPFGNHRVLPAGPLRERKIGLSRAHLVIQTRADDPDKGRSGIDQIEAYTQASIVSSSHRPIAWMDLNNNQYPLDFINGKFVLAVAGIGNPDAFLNTLHQLNIVPVDFIRFVDHYWYKQYDMEKIMIRAVSMGAIAVLTTEKDGVRMRGMINLDLPVYCLKIRCELHDFSVIQNVFDQRRS